jgi:hypothetical protein
LPRQQTLRATMDWSYDLLAQDERTLLNRLSVFSGSFSLDAVEAICADKTGDDLPAGGIQPSQVLDLLGALVDHSLIKVQEKKGEIYYSLLETVRQYTLEKLVASGGLNDLQDRHLAYYLEIAERGYPYIRAGDPIWMERFEAEYDNLRSAMEYAIVHSLESAIRFELPLAWFTDFTNRQREHYNWAIRIVELTDSWPPGKLRALALEVAGFRHSDFGEFPQGQAYLAASLEMVRDLQDKELMNLVLHDLQILNTGMGNWRLLNDYALQHLEISRELGDIEEISCALWNLGEAARRRGDSQAGRQFFEQSLETARQVNNQNIIAFDLMSLGKLAHSEGEMNKAKEMYMECAQIRRDFGYEAGFAGSLYRLAQVYLQEGDAIQTKKLAEESLQIFRELKSVSMQVLCLNLLAGAAGIDRQEERAARLFGAAEQLNAEADDLYHMAYDPIIAAVRDVLGEADFNQAWEEGRQLSLEQAFELAFI